MKISNLLLGLVTLCCALGSAVAAKVFVPQPTWISGTTTLGFQTCSTIGDQCDTATGNTRNCQVSVTLSTGVVKSTIGYSTNACSVPLRTGNVAAVAVTKSNLQDVTIYNP